MCAGIRMTVQSFDKFSPQATNARIKVSVLNKAPLYCLKAPGMIMSKISGLAALAAVNVSSATWNWLKKPVAPAPQIHAKDRKCVKLEKMVVSVWREVWRPFSSGCRALETWMIDRVQSFVVPKSDPATVRDEAMMQRMDAIVARIEIGGLALAWLRSNQPNACMSWSERFLVNAKGAVARVVDADGLATAAEDLRSLCEKSKQLLTLEPKLHRLANAMYTLAQEEFTKPFGDMIRDRTGKLYQERDAALERLSQLRQRRIAENKEIVVRQKLIEIAQTPSYGWTARLLDVASFSESHHYNTELHGINAVEAANFKAQSAAITSAFGSRIANWIALSKSVRTSVSAISEISNSGLSLARECAKRKVAIKLTRLTLKTLCTVSFQLLAWSAVLSSFGRRHICNLESKFLPEKLLLLQGCDPKNDEFMSARQMILLGVVISGLIAYRSELLQRLHRGQNEQGFSVFAELELDSVLPKPRTLIAIATRTIAKGVSGGAGLVGVSISRNLRRFNQRSIAEMNSIFGQKRSVPQQHAEVPLPMLDCIPEESPNQTPD